MRDLNHRVIDYIDGVTRSLFPEEAKGKHTKQAIFSKIATRIYQSHIVET